MSGSRLFTALIVGCAIAWMSCGWAQDEEMNVAERGKEVKMNGVIDLHDEQVAQAQQSINANGMYTVLSKTFLPPNPFWSFKLFPAKGTRVDIAGDPNALPARRREDTARRIKVEKNDIPADNAGNMPLRTEGNLTPTAGGSGGLSIGGSSEFHWSVLTSAYDVAIGDVVRREDLPFSVPPGRTRDVTVVIRGGGTFRFEVVNGDANNGTARIVRTSEGTLDTLTMSGTVTVQGDRVTEVGCSGMLQIKATSGGNTVGLSSGFSVCPHFANYRMIDVNQGNLRYGFFVNETWNSDSATGQVTELDQCFRKEDVIKTRHDNPPWLPTDLKKDQVWEAGDIDGTNGPGMRIDQHWISSDKLINQPRNAGKAVRSQNHLFYCYRCGMTMASPKPIPAPFTITYNCELNDKGEYVVTTTKTGEGGPLPREPKPEAGQAPNEPSGLRAVATVDKANNLLTITTTWTDESLWAGQALTDPLSLFHIERSVPGFRAKEENLARNAREHVASNIIWDQYAGKTMTITLWAQNWRGKSKNVTVEVKIPE